ncbi:hypothetical protein G4G28_05050 [Massilia sp. Dwa41.01b]|uniref:hypothetical protein n=1 Tax=unclassified Massilia TaxID=2609279 RepID=UPI001604827D|nr:MULTISPECIES: hypothetical protein [unclassified Massilia]QNA88005.1 hypothetical protein G4G28_05050 [Massilia sp. Dwa41.01b]QNA98906.1 hypothetical protein G4G31_08765 [Massilia sp. Se16.2.3]
MRHLFALPVFCAAMAACAAPGGGPPGPITLALHASAQIAPGLTLTYDSVEDSRCPPGVHCVWAGVLAYHFSLQGKNGPAERFELQPGKPGHASALLPGARIELDESIAASPPPQGAAPTLPVRLRVKPA